MKYLLLIYSDEGAWTDSERKHCYEESTQLAHQLKTKGRPVLEIPDLPTA